MALTDVINNAAMTRCFRFILETPIYFNYSRLSALFDQLLADPQIPGIERTLHEGIEAVDFNTI